MLPSVTKIYELYYSLKMVNLDQNMSEFLKIVFNRSDCFKVLRR